MAIYSAVPPPPEQTTPQQGHAILPASPAHHQSATGIDIDAWTISALQSLSVSPVARGTGTPLAINIDEQKDTPSKRSAVAFADGEGKAVEDTPRRPPSRRDSLKRREALLKGKEGSRQRRRWENDRLMGVPNAQPPQPTDWEVRPTHTIHYNMPYQLAQFWDRGIRQRVEDKTTHLAAQRKKQQLQRGSATGLGKGEVPRDLRESAKRSPAVKSWVRALEEPVRQFLHSHSPESKKLEEESDDSLDSEDEEIVFVGRRKATAEQQKPGGGWKMAHREVEKETVDEGMVFDTFGNDDGAAFQRWLTHSISDYYGLQSKSIMLKDPSRKAVYVGLKPVHQRGNMSMKQMPAPMWERC